MKSFPLYLTEPEIQEWAWALMQLQTLVEMASPDRPCSNQAARMLTALRLQCCLRSGAADPFPGHPFTPGIFEGVLKPRRRRK